MFLSQIYQRSIYGNGSRGTWRWIIGGKAFRKVTNTMEMQLYKEHDCQYTKESSDPITEADNVVNL